MEWSEVQAAFPRDTVLASIDSTEGAIYLEMASLQADKDTLGVRYTPVLRLLAAHYGRSLGDASGGNSGDIVSESVDGVSRSYAQVATQPGESDADWSTTSYGKKALALIRSCPETRLPRMY